MSEKRPTQAMPQDGLKGAPDGTNRPGEGAYPNPHQDRTPGFEGGQTGKGYHGSQQLGEDKVAGKPNPNAAAKSD